MFNNLFRLEWPNFRKSEKKLRFLIVNNNGKTCVQKIAHENKLIDVFYEFQIIFILKILNYNVFLFFFVTSSNSIEVFMIQKPWRTFFLLTLRVWSSFSIFHSNNHVFLSKFEMKSKIRSAWISSESHERLIMRGEKGTVWIMKSGGSVSTNIFMIFF